MKACGNPDFVNADMMKAIKLNKTIKVSFENDLYSLGLMCYLILGDSKRKFFTSLS
jgi:hypothetical protein